MDNEVEVMAELIRINEAYGNWQRVGEIMPLLSSYPDRGIAGLAAALNKTNDNQIRHFSMQILFQMEPHEAVLAPLIAALHDTDYVLRLNTVDLLSRLGPKSVAALPVIETWLEHLDETTQLMATVAICKINPRQICDLSPQLKQHALGAKDLSDKATAIQTIGELYADIPEALPFLESLLTSG